MNIRKKECRDVSVVHLEKGRCFSETSLQRTNAIKAFQTLTLTLSQPKRRNRVNPPRMRGKTAKAVRGRAFTLVELIVVITILAILGTIAFISLQGYARDARDTKRVSDIRQLLTKLEIEHTKGVPYSNLIDAGDDLTPKSKTEVGEKGCYTGKVLGQENIKICQGPVNFPAINENQNSFRNGTEDYIFAYTSPVPISQGNGRIENREFIQGTTTLENGKNRVVGDYYTKDGDDTPGLVVDTGGNPIIDGGNGDVATPPTHSCATPTPSGAGIDTTTTGSPTSINQAWVKDAANCGFTCKANYSGDNCENLSIDGKTRIHYGTGTFTWTPNSTSPSGTNCRGKWESSAQTNGEYNIPQTSGEYTFRCGGGAIFAGYDYTKKLSQYPAFKACSDLGAGWRLPTKAELSSFYTARDSIGKPAILKNDSTSATLESSSYWPSSEYNADNAWYVHMTNGNVDAGLKTYGRYIVCVLD